MTIWEENENYPKFNNSYEKHNSQTSIFAKTVFRAFTHQRGDGTKGTVKEPTKRKSLRILKCGLVLRGHVVRVRGMSVFPFVLHSLVLGFLVIPLLLPMVSKREKIKCREK